MKMNSIKTEINKLIDLKLTVLPVYVTYIPDLRKKNPFFGNGIGWKTKHSLNDRFNALNGRENGIVLITGKQSNVFSIDVDIGNGKRGFETLSILNITIPEKTVSFKTQGGGMQYLFRYPSILRTTTRANIFGENSGIDLRGENGFCFIPPTRVENGGFYEWIVSPFEEKLKLVPENILRIIQGTEKKNKQKFHDGFKSLCQLSVKQRKILNNLRIEAETIAENKTVRGIGDRSLADYQLVKWAVKCNLKKSEIERVCNFGKFLESSNYFATTYENVLRAY